MGKSSSSHKKKKRSKKSSKVRSRKISKTSNRKSKSKKLHRKDSNSDSSDDDSRSSFSISSYSSEDEYRSKRARSRTRKDPKSGKKRARRQSSSSEDSLHLRKKKDGGSRGRKRTHQKKKKKKARRGSSTDSFDLSESEYERQKESGEGNIDKIDRYRCMDQPTLYDQRVKNSDHWIEEKGINENNSRRLRSVIIVIKQEHEGSESEEHKEEIVCDHDNYPSCRSNDSSDGGSKKESGYNSSFDSKNKVEIEVEKEGAVEAQDPNGEDLESVLRRRALENLKKFRVKGSSGSDPLEQTLAVKVEPLQNKPPDELQEKVNAAAASVTDKPKLVAAASTLQNSSKPQTLKQAQQIHKQNVISAGDAQSRNGSEGGEGVNDNAHVSAIMEPPSLKSPPEAKETSQYEQKTMSVMRGGEMVQVSYQVYIPKKAPALARRQLKR